MVVQHVGPAALYIDFDSFFASAEQHLRPELRGRPVGITPLASEYTSLIAASPEMAWCDTSRRGYLTVSFTPEAARCDWVFMSTIRERTLATSAGQAATVQRGKRKMTLA